jgi:SAM-dependent methyltransferase
MGIHFQNTGEIASPVLVPRLAAMLADAAHGKTALLDYGCGYGNWTAYFLGMAKHLRYSVSDPDKSAEGFAASLSPPRYDRFREHFDLIVCFAVLELLPEEDQRRLLGRFRDRLEPCGELVVQYNVYNPISPRWLLMAVRSLGKARQFHEARRFHRSYLTAPEVETMFAKSGFRIVAVETNLLFHLWPRRFDDIARKVFRSRMFYSQMFYRLKIS